MVKYKNVEWKDIYTKFILWLPEESLEGDSNCGGRWMLHFFYRTLMKPEQKGLNLSHLYLSPSPSEVQDEATTLPAELLPT